MRPLAGVTRGRPLGDDQLDRLDVEGWQHLERTNTKGRGLMCVLGFRPHTEGWMLRGDWFSSERCDGGSGTDCIHPRGWVRVEDRQRRHWLVADAAGVHPVPSRTRSLSPPAPMVLGGKPPGSVGRCQPFCPASAFLLLLPSDVFFIFPILFLIL